MEISLERLRVKGVFSILSSSFSVLKSIFFNYTQYNLSSSPVIRACF